MIASLYCNTLHSWNTLRILYSEVQCVAFCSKYLNRTVKCPQAIEYREVVDCAKCSIDARARRREDI